MVTAERTQVAIIGAGPAGLMLGRLLELQGIESVILEARTREYCEARQRAGLLEQGTCDVLTGAGVGERLQREGMVHGGIYLQVDDERKHIPMEELTGRCVTIYAQTEVVKDLIEARLASGAPLLFEVEAVELDELEADQPVVRYRDGGVEHELRADFIAGCDGFHGVSRPSIPEHLQQLWQRDYPFGWLGSSRTLPRPPRSWCIRATSAALRC